MDHGDRNDVDRRCKEKADGEPLGTLRVVVIVKEAGGATAILAKPDTEYSRCVVQAFTHFEFPRPPALFGDGFLPVLYEIKVK